MDGVYMATGANRVNIFYETHVSTESWDYFRFVDRHSLIHSESESGHSSSSAASRAHSMNDGCDGAKNHFILYISLYHLYVMQTPPAIYPPAMKYTHMIILRMISQIRLELL